MGGLVHRRPNALEPTRITNAKDPRAFWTDRYVDVLLERRVAHRHLEHVEVRVRRAAHAAEGCALVVLILHGGLQRPVTAVQPRIPEADLKPRCGPGIGRADRLHSRGRDDVAPGVDEIWIAVAEGVGAGAAEVLSFASMPP